MVSSWIISAVGTYKSDRKDFDSNALNLYNNCECGTFAIFCDGKLGMVISINIQTLSIAIK